MRNVGRVLHPEGVNRSEFSSEEGCADPSREKRENLLCGQITKGLRKEVFGFTRKLPAACRKILTFSK
jgi:hypothetical protein